MKCVWIFIRFQSSKLISPPLLCYIFHCRRRNWWKYIAVAMNAYCYLEYLRFYLNWIFIRFQSSKLISPPLLCYIFHCRRRNWWKYIAVAMNAYCYLEYLRFYLNAQVNCRWRESIFCKSRFVLFQSAKKPRKLSFWWRHEIASKMAIFNFLAKKPL